MLKVTTKDTDGKHEHKGVDEPAPGDTDYCKPFEEMSIRDVDDDTLQIVGSYNRQQLFLSVSGPHTGVPENKDGTLQFDRKMVKQLRDTLDAFLSGK